MPIRQPVSRRRTTTRKGAALCVEILAIGLRIVQIARTSIRNQQMLLLPVLMVEHLGMVIYLQFFQYVIFLIGGLTSGKIFMCVLIFLCSLLTRSQGLAPC